jgi:hypothetical protein
LAPTSFLQTQDVLQSFGMNQFVVAQNAVELAAAHVA